MFIFKSTKAVCSIFYHHFALLLPNLVQWLPIFGFFSDLMVKSQGQTAGDEFNCCLVIIPHAKSCGGYNVFDPSVSQSVSPVYLVSATPLKPLNRISWNFVVMKDIMCRCAYPQEISIPFFFSELRPFLNFEIWRKWKIPLKQLVSTTPLKPLNRIAWNFVVMKGIMCRYAFWQEMLIWSFSGAI